MNRRAAVGLALAFLGCRASFVETKRRISGPVPEVGLIDAGGGHIRYALKGPSFLVNRRKTDAFNKMADYCHGADLARITKEYTQDDAETPYHASDLDESLSLSIEHYKVETYRHIEFECLKNQSK